MGLKNRNLITIDDLTNSEIEAIFSLADDMESDIRGHSELCKGYVMASLFYEPSTRTRLSFETAMHKLGGSVVTAAEVSSSSIAKGESLADTARVVGSYVDIIVMRHPWEGAARAMANYAGVPVINAGDGSHEHPTQTLCDLYTLRREKGRIEDLTVAVCGDLKSARTAHSLTYALARFGANIVFIPSKGYELPDHVKEKLEREYTGNLWQAGQPTPDPAEDAELGSLDVIYQTPAEPHQLALLTDVKPAIKPAKYDVLYATRLQKERHSGQQRPTENGFVKVDRRLMGRPEFKKALVMHPLPRVDEIAHELDEDPRSM
ncbi:MAG: aspartate carbamoyltransferase, partial [Dehalococcoidia bacterium]